MYTLFIRYIHHVGLIMCIVYCIVNLSRTYGSHLNIIIPRLSTLEHVSLTVVPIELQNVKYSKAIILMSRYFVGNYTDYDEQHVSFWGWPSELKIA